MMPTFKPIKNENIKGRITAIPEMTFAKSENELKKKMKKNKLRKAGFVCKNNFSFFHIQSG